MNRRKKLLLSAGLVGAVALAVAIGQPFAVAKATFKAVESSDATALASLIDAPALRQDQAMQITQQAQGGSPRARKLQALGEAMVPLMVERAAWENSDPAFLLQRLHDANGRNALEGSSLEFSGPATFLLHPAHPGAPTLVFRRRGWNWKIVGTQWDNGIP